MSYVHYITLCALLIAVFVLRFIQEPMGAVIFCQSLMPELITLDHWVACISLPGRHTLAAIYVFPTLYIHILYFFFFPIIFTAWGDGLGAPL